MANSKVSTLTAAAALDGTELYYVDQGGADRKVTGTQIQTLAGGLTSVTVALTASQINHLFSAPQTLIAAPGAGKAIIYLSFQFMLRVGTIPFDSENGSAGVYYGSTGGLDFGIPIATTFVSKFLHSSPVNAAFASIENQPIVAAGITEDLINGGAIATATVNAGGAGYAPGDTGSVNSQSTAIYVVDAVSGGAVTAFHFSDAGFGNNVGTATTIVSTGTGNGSFKINITSITPGNGSASVAITYQTITLP